ncbi:pickpocket protein 19 [Drosophila rhopaloa]|uniref:Pickpocket protein 19 n=1 Tax=Drosophila rhopaloa TaxID=1041015 RepID=A0A6P4FNI6_DRORH|nr:pickpocket protein 19 [Drosophila rhopaloa]
MAANESCPSNCNFIKLLPFVMLLYTRELVAPRLNQGLLRFRRKQQRIKYQDRLRSAFDHCTIHGMQHVSGERHLWQRLLWISIALGAGVAGFSMYSVLRLRLSEQLLVSLIDTTQLPVYHIDFPAVAICPWSHVNWQRAPSALIRFLPENPDAHLRETFRHLLVVLDLTSFSNFKRASDMGKEIAIGWTFFSMKQLMNYLAYRCEELFIPGSCVFDETYYDCCQLFVPEQTEKGQCLVFNSLISDHSRKKQLTNKFYPHKLSTAGEESGLMFTINASHPFVRAGKETPFGMNLMIKKPSQWSSEIIYNLYPDTENFVAVNPLVMETSTNTHKMSPRKRRCYFDNEQSPYFQNTSLTYDRANCMVVCLHQVVLKTCNCSAPVFLPPIGLEGIRECGVLDAKCLSSNADIFSYVRMGDQDKYINDSRHGYFCDCPDNCNSWQYKMTLNVRKLDYPKNSTERLIKGQIYYGQRVMTKIITKLKYTNLDLLANFGGIISLFMGASVMSFIELVFVVGKLMWVFIKDGYAKLNDQIK